MTSRLATLYYLYKTVKSSRLSESYWCNSRLSIFRSFLSVGISIYKDPVPGELLGSFGVQAQVDFYWLHFALAYEHRKQASFMRLNTITSRTPSPRV
jgi:hypothetical protein